MVLLLDTILAHDSCRMLLQPSNIQFDKGHTHTGPGGQSGMHKWDTPLHKWDTSVHKWNASVHTCGITHACEAPSAPLGARHKQAIAEVCYAHLTCWHHAIFLFRQASVNLDGLFISSRLVRNSDGPQALGHPVYWTTSSLGPPDSCAEPYVQDPYHP